MKQSKMDPYCTKELECNESNSFIYVVLHVAELMGDLLIFFELRLIVGD